MHSKKAFTLIELLVVIAIIAILSVVVILSLNPAELLRQSRDSTRLSDMDTMNHALSLYAADQGGSTSFSLGNAKTVYVSLPDSSSTCGDLSLPILPTGWSYACVASASSKNINGTGWIPVNLSNISSGSPLGSLPLDPTNQSSSRLYYTYTTNGSQYELTSAMESQKYGLGGSNDVISTDGGTLATVYEKGSKLGLEPLDYGDSSLVGLWTFDEGVGSTTYDYSGNNATGSWSGTATGTSGFYSVGKIGPWAGAFDGSSTIAVISETSSLELGTGDFTVTAWYYLNALPGAYKYIMEKGGSGAVGFSIDIASNNYPDCSIQAVGGSNQHSSFYGTSPIGQWVYLACVYARSSGVLTGYLNGTPSANLGYNTGNNTGSVTNVGYNVQVGAFNNGNYFSGLVDDARIYKRALSVAQIQAIYNGGK